VNHRLVLAVICGVIGGCLLTVGAGLIHTGLAIMVVGGLLLGFALLGLDVTPPRVTRDGRTLRRSDR